MAACNAQAKLHHTGYIEGQIAGGYQAGSSLRDLFLLDQIDQFALAAFVSEQDAVTLPCYAKGLGKGPKHD